ncbi:MAG: cytochrome C [Thiovulaceae bacterium]|nr:cytochrome C [Sulfurimonadaceae bacterium]MCW9025881.1 cytochrome C [Sulfurimonadaceae bacterium]
MKKVLLTLAVSSIVTFASADEKTIKATMSLMTQGMAQIQHGFAYSNRMDVENGIKVLENANAIFSKVDVSTFIQHNKKVQVTKNINENLAENLEAFKKAVKAQDYTESTKYYGKVTSNCIACHRTIRGW